MPYSLTAKDLIKSSVEIARDSAKLTTKLRTLRKYSLLGPLLQQAPLGKVCMFHIGRSGSTVLARLLDQHPKVYWGHEVYLPIFKAYRQKKLWGTTVEADARSVLEKSSRWAGRRYFGFEVKLWHLARTDMPVADYLELLRDFGVEQFIILERKNELRRFVSSRVGVKHGRIEVKKSAETSLLTVEVPLTISIYKKGEVSLAEYLQIQEGEFAELRRLLKDDRVLELTSAEDVFPNPDDGYKRICEFMGIEPDRLAE